MRMSRQVGDRYMIDQEVPEYRRGGAHAAGAEPRRSPRERLTSSQRIRKTDFVLRTDYDYEGTTS